MPETWGQPFDAITRGLMNRATGGGTAQPQAATNGSRHISGPRASFAPCIGGARRVAKQGMQPAPPEKGHSHRVHGQRSSRRPCPSRCKKPGQMRGPPHNGIGHMCYGQTCSRVLGPPENLHSHRRHGHKSSSRRPCPSRRKETRQLRGHLGLMSPENVYSYRRHGQKSSSRRPCPRRRKETSQLRNHHHRLGRVKRMVPSSFKPSVTPMGRQWTNRGPASQKAT